MVNKQSAFTLIELLTVVAVLAVLSAVAIPFTKSWHRSIAQQEMKHVLQEAVGQTKSLALRNPHGSVSSASVAEMFVLSNSVEVRDLVSNTTVWSAPINSNIRITNPSDQDVVCVRMNSRGFLMSGSSCSTNQTLYVSLNSHTPLEVRVM